MFNFTNIKNNDHKNNNHILDVIFIGADYELQRHAEEYNKKSNGLIDHYISLYGDKKYHNTTHFLSFKDGDNYCNVLLYFVGTVEQKQDSESIGASIYDYANKSHFDNINILCDDLIPSHHVGAVEQKLHMIFGLLLQSYKFDRFVTKNYDGNDGNDGDKENISSFHIISDSYDYLEKEFIYYQAIASGIFFTRDLVSLPPNILYPEYFAEQCKSLCDIGVDVSIFDEKKLKDIGMNALLGVGQGSVRDSYVVVMHWKGASDDVSPVAFVGKGVTFDTGGISLKPGAGMHEMKWDMGGAGAVCGAMHALAARKAKANIIGIIGLVENMPDGNAQRPGDIVTSLSGQTIEIHNTDAEGRLVLADLLWYIKHEYNPSYMIDLATLTGAIILSLGNEYAGLFSNDEALSNMLSHAGQSVNEKLWSMPMDKIYDKQLKTAGADMKNIGGRYGGAIIAAKFLERFVDNCPWAHLDIAGTAWDNKGKPTMPAGATGYGVKLLNQFIKDNFEQ